jgi:hypothetical protein
MTKLIVAFLKFAKAPKKYMHVSDTKHYIQESTLEFLRTSKEKSVDLFFVKKYGHFLGTLMTRLMIAACRKEKCDPAFHRDLFL